MTLTMDHLKNKLFFYVRDNNKIKVDSFSFSKGLDFRYVVSAPDSKPYTLAPSNLHIFSTSKEIRKWFIIGDYKLGVWDEDTLDLP